MRVEVSRLTALCVFNAVMKLTNRELGKQLKTSKAESRMCKLLIQCMNNTLLYAMYNKENK